MILVTGQRPDDARSERGDIRLQVGGEPTRHRAGRIHDVGRRPPLWRRELKRWLIQGEATKHAVGTARAEEADGSPREGYVGAGTCPAGEELEGLHGGPPANAFTSSCQATEAEEEEVVAAEDEPPVLPPPPNASTSSFQLTCEWWVGGVWGGRGPARGDRSMRR